MTTSESAPATIADGVRAVREELSAQVPADVLAAFDGQAEALAEQDFAARAPQPGDQAPRFTLPDSEGREVSLDGLLAEGPVVLAFYRGAWCPYCNVQLRAYQEAQEEIEARGARLVAVSPQTPTQGEAFRDAAGLAFTVLSDAGAAVAERYGLAFEVGPDDREPFAAVGIEVAESNADGGWRLPTPGTFVLAGDGTVLLAGVDGDFRRRTEVAALLGALDAPRS